MKKLWLFLLMVCPAAFAQTVDVTYTFTDFNLTAQAVRRATQTPIQPLADYNGAILTSKPQSQVTSGSGSATFSNTVCGYVYRIQLDTPYGSTVRTCSFPTTVSGAVNGRDFLGNTGPGNAFYFLYPVESSTTNSPGSAGYALYTAGDGKTHYWAAAGSAATATNAAITIAANSNAVYQAQISNSNTVYQAEFANSNALYQSEFANSNSVYQSKFVNKSGDTMTGGLTNNSGYYGETLVLTGATIQVTLQGKADDSAAAIQLFRTTASGNGWELQKDPDSAGGFFRLNSSTNAFVNLNQWFSWNPVTGATINSGAGFFGIGSGLTALNGSQVTSGTIADARLSANVPLLNATNNFTGATNYFLTGVFTNLIINGGPTTTVSNLNVNGWGTVQGTFTNGGPAYYSNNIVALPGAKFAGDLSLGTNLPAIQLAQRGYHIPTNGVIAYANGTVTVDCSRAIVTIPTNNSFQIILGNTAAGTNSLTSIVVTNFGASTIYATNPATSRPIGAVTTNALALASGKQGYFSTDTIQGVRTNYCNASEQ